MDILDRWASLIDGTQRPDRSPVMHAALPFSANAGANVALFGYTEAMVNAHLTPPGGASTQQTSPAAIKSSGGAIGGGPNAQPPPKT